MVPIVTMIEFTAAHHLKFKEEAQWNNVCHFPQKLYIK